MPVSCIAARPLPGSNLSANGLGVPPALLAELGISPGALVELTAGDERAWANAEAVGGDGGPVHVLRLGRMLWPALDVKPDGAVTVAPAGELPLAESVRITPPFNLTFQVHQRLLDSIRESGMPLYPGSRVMAEVFRGGAGMIVRIDAVSPSPARLGPDTEVELHKADTAVSERVIGLADVGGADGIIRRLRELVELPLLRPGFYRRLGVRPPKGVLLYGPPGTGKTLTCKALANELGVTAFKMSSTELVGSVTGETEANLRLLFSRALSHAPALVMIDEFDVIATNRERLASQSDVRAASQLLTLLDGLEEVDGVVLVATTNRIQAIDPAFRRPGRFEEEIFMGPPDEAGRYEILSIHTREMPLSVSAQEALGDIAAKTGGFVGADLMHLARSAGLCATQRLAPRKSGFEAADSLEFTELAVEAEDFWNALKVVRPSVLRDVVTRAERTTWPEIVGLDNVKTRISELAKRAITITSEPDTQGVLLYGPAGSGKSAVAHAIVAELGVNFVSIEGSRVFNQWLGESEEAVRALFRRALDARPSVLLLDHLDSLAPVREGGGGERTDERVVAALLAALDDTLAEGGVFVIATTSRPELVDPAVLRSGRIGMHIEIPNPDADRRRALLASLTSTFGLGLSNGFLDELTEGTTDWSAADVAMFVREGVQRAAMEQRELSVTDLIETLPNMTRI